MNRRTFLTSAGSLLAGAATTGAQPANAFQQRGYYFTFGRMPTLGLAEWKQIVDGIAADHGNLILLWIAGGFRSKKFPITWQYNTDHRNVRQDFVRELIDYAHGRNISVLLGFTPFSYDGVNQYPLQHPQLKALQAGGRYAKLSGIHSWGYALNPANPLCQRFMLDYVREMYFDFYPNADGLLIESSDYDICEGGDCAGRYYDLEYEFVRAISTEAWARNPSATVVVYPHYFTGAKVPGFRASGARRDFDPRYTLFFTPHSAQFDDSLLAKARTTMYWDPCTALGNPAATQTAAQRAENRHMTGFVTSHEAFSYIAENPDFGERSLLGKRLKPFGFDWIADGVNPYEDPLVRVNRVAFRTYATYPGAPGSAFEAALEQDLQSSSVKDILRVHTCCYQHRSWTSASPAFRPAILREALALGRINRADLESVRSSLRELEPAVQRLSQDRSPAARHCVKVAESILSAWDRQSRDFLARHLS